jgi:predicted dehydrogenase
MSKILLLGTGYMAEEYSKVLQDMSYEFEVVGNTKLGCDRFFQRTGIQAKPGSTSKIKDASGFKFAINAASSDQLFYTNKFLIDKGIENILSEKPGALYLEELQELQECSKAKKLFFCIAYNRRFYSSVDKLRELVKNEGGVESFFFDFTEWEANVLNQGYNNEILRNWFAVNSLHVIDLAFFLGGNPTQLGSNISGGSNWHKPMTYSGSGKTNTDALFSYIANWNSAGRWGIEVNTKSNKYILRPLEKLQRIKKASTEMNFVQIKDSYDTDFKPGLYNQVKSFLSYQDDDRLITLEEHANNFKSIYVAILNGNQTL